MAFNKVVAIDVGGSKTEVVIFDVGSNNIVKWFIGAPCKIHDMPSSDVIQSLKGIISRLDLDFSEAIVSMGIAGLDTRFDQMTWRDIVNEVFPKDAFIDIFHDVVEVLYAGGYGEPGIVVIAGTGFNAYGKSRTGEAKAGDWGWRIGDEASAYRIGISLLNNAFRFLDGRGGSRIIYKGILDYLGLNDWEELLDWVYKSGVNEIASLALLACELSNHPSVYKIFRKVVKEAIIAVEAVSRRVGLKGPVHYTGGLFQCNIFKRLFVDHLIERGFEIGEYVSRPVIGAIFKALIDFLGYSKDEVVQLAQTNIRRLNDFK